MGTKKDASKAPTATVRRKALQSLEQSLKSRSRGDDWFERWTLGRLEPGWIYAMQLRPEHGRWVVGELKVFPESDLLNRDRLKHWIAEPRDFPKIPAGGLTARQLRRISFHPPMLVAMSGLMKAAKAIARHYEKGASLIKRGDKDLKLVHIAATYVDLLRRHSQQPTADCAQRLGLSVSRVRDAIHQARVRKLLTGSRGQGSAGGELTSEALALLESDSSSLDVAQSPKTTSAQARSGTRKTPQSPAERQ